MKIWPEMEQRSEAWFRARAGRPTASQFERLITPTGKDSEQWDDFALELCAQCIRPDEVEWEGNRHTDRGTELEPEARALFSDLIGLEVSEVGFVTRDDEVVGCSPDGLVSNADGDYVAGLELKCPLSKHHARYLIDGELPAKYRPQVHGSMAVTGLRFWYFMSYCPGLAPFITRVEWDAYTDKVADVLDRFVVYYAERRKQVLPRLLGKEAA
jgi:hypothetical protein